MGALTFPLILLVIVGIFGVVFFVVTKKQEKASNLLAKDSKTASKNPNNAKNEAKKEEIKKEDVFKFMEFDRVLDSMIVQNNGSKFTMAIKCKGINYDLMSDVEQISVEEGFITFLNTLRYPIQLYVQAQNVDLKGVIQEYKNNIGGVRADFERLDDEYNKVVESFDSTHQEIEKIENERNKVLNVYEYAADIINYVERMSTNKSLLQRNFYVLVSYKSSEIAGLDKFSKEEILNICYTELLTRAQGIINGLSACSVEGKVLDSNEVADLLYMAYNRDDKGLLSVKEAIDSGFYRLYSTSEEAFFKRSELLNEQIEQEAKIKSLAALKRAIERGEYATPKMKEMEVTERIAREASEMIKHEDLPEQIKKEAQDSIAKEFRTTKKNLIQEAAIERTQIVEQIESVTETDKGKDVLKKEEEKRLAEEQKEREREQLQNANNALDNENIDTESKPEMNIPKNLILDSDINNSEEQLIREPINSYNAGENDFSSFDDRLGSTSDDENDDVIR